MPLPPLPSSVGDLVPDELLNNIVTYAFNGTQRGGASDASHMAGHVELSIDGLGPRGGGAHAPREYILADSLRTRAEVALAVTAAALRG